MNPYLLLTISIVLGIGGQISLKAGAMQSVKNQLLLFQPYIFVGLSSYFLAAFFYIYALKKIPLSVAFPSVSISYVVVAYLAHLIWGEPFGMKQIFSLAFIGFGIYNLTR